MEEPEPPEPSFLDKLRNTWELANLMQYIYLFGRAVKIDENLDIEVKESSWSQKHLAIPMPAFAAQQNRRCEC